MIHFYYSMINLGSGELSPVNEIEFAWFSFSLVLSILVFSFWFSKLTSLLIDLVIDSIIKQSLLDDSNTIMIHMELSG
jgi:hypothetical protein